MTFRKNLLRKVIALLLLPVLLASAVLPVSADSPHEDPAGARVLYSAISLFFYYNDSLGFVLQRQPADVEGWLVKMPFTNLPFPVRTANDSFVPASVSVANVVIDLDNDVAKVRALMRQSRFTEIAQLSNVVGEHLSRMRENITEMKEKVRTIADEFDVFSSPGDSDVRMAYNQLRSTLDQIEALLAYYFEQLRLELLNLVESVSQSASPALQQALEGLRLSSREQLLELAMSVLERQWPQQLDAAVLRMLFEVTEITLQIEPTTAFVGDSVHFEGMLTSAGKPLAGKEVTLLLDGVPFLTASTDASGRYEGTLHVPYRYVPVMKFQALYYPRNGDVGRYLSSTSQVVELDILFYTATITLELPAKAYPGREATVSGHVDYGQSPVLTARQVEIYVDNLLVADTMAAGAFTENMRLSPDMEVGAHLITVSLGAAGRYAPAVVSGTLNVSKARTVVEMGTPGIALIPGSIGLNGRLYSEVGPLAAANIEVVIGGSRAKFLSSADGSFDSRISIGVDLSLMGSRDMDIAVRSSEPWNTDTVATRRVPYINWVSSLGILAIAAVLVFYVPGRMRSFRRHRPVRVPVPVANGGVPRPSPQENASVSGAAVSTSPDGDSGEPRSRVFYWYRFSARLVQVFTGSILRAQQTLREFARDTGRMLGPASRYFMDLTMIVERLLYSSHAPTEEDADRSKQLSGSIADSVDGGATAGKTQT